MTTLAPQTLAGWSIVNSEGIATVYLAIIDEGMTTSPTDTPANVQYKPRILNPETFSISRAPLAWFEGDSSNSAATFSELQISNYDGAFDFLISADLRDTTVILKLAQAGSMQKGTAINDALTVATAIIDSVSSDDEDVITLRLKDTLARLDKVLPVRMNPPFVDQGAANTMIPISLGAVRNVKAQCIDSENLYYLMHDAPMGNLTNVADMAAPLNGTSTPVQYTPINGGAGFQLTNAPAGVITFDGSSFGSQAVIAGASDILAGAGAFPDPWTGQNVGKTSTTTNNPITLASGTYTIPVASTSGFTAGDSVYIVSGGNSIFGPVNAVLSVPARLTILASAATVTGTPTSIPATTSVIHAGVPKGFTFTGGSGTTISEQKNPPYAFLGTSNMAFIRTGNVWNPNGGQFADSLKLATAVLQPGTTYRISVSLYNMQQESPYFISGMLGGVILASALSTNAADYITGITSPITTSAFGSQNFTFEYTVPSSGSARNLYAIFAPSAGNAANTAQGFVSGYIYNLKIQRIGQFTEEPLSAMPFADYVTEVLVNRAGEAASIFNSTEAAALFVRSDGTLMPFGNHFEGNPPNILKALQDPLDTVGAVKFTDSLGTIRFRRQLNPSDPANQTTVKAAFTDANILRPISVRPDNPQYMTTTYGARRNWYQFGQSDYVTDAVIVTQDIKTRFSRASQFWVSSSLRPASQYTNAIAAPLFDSLFDLASDAQTEVDRITSIRSPQFYANGTFSSGKRRLVTFTATFDDPLLVGVGTTAVCTDIQYGDMVTIDYPRHGFNAQFAEVVVWVLFPFAQKMQFTCLV